MRLFLCEKPSQGKDIGRILGATQRGEGCLNGSGVTVTWCIGHLVEAAAPEVYDAALKRWSLEQLPIIPQQWRVEVKPKTATQFKVVKALLAKATQLVIATDADREGAHQLRPAGGAEQRLRRHAPDVCHGHDVHRTAYVLDHGLGLGGRSCRQRVARPRRSHRRCQGCWRKGRKHCDQCSVEEVIAASRPRHEDQCGNRRRCIGRILLVRFATLARATPRPSRCCGPSRQPP